MGVKRILGDAAEDSVIGNVTHQMTTPPDNLLESQVFLNCPNNDKTVTELPNLNLNGFKIVFWAWPRLPYARTVYSLFLRERFCR